MFSLDILFLCFANDALGQLFELGLQKSEVQDSLLERNGYTQPKGLEVTVYNDLAHQRYLSNITVGTPPRLYHVMMDTASTDLWLPAWNSSGCAPNPCPAGTWKPEDSITSVATGWTYNVTFGLTPEFFIIGEYYNDTVTIGDVAIKMQTLAVGDVPSAIFEPDGNGLWGILGLGPRLHESLYVSPASRFRGEESATYTPFWQNLLLERHLPNLFSVWLNKQSAKTGTFLFGEVDHTKYERELQGVPIELSADGKFMDWRVNLTSVTRIDGHGNSDLLTNATISNVVLDTGSPNMYIPSTLYRAISAPLNVTIINSTTPYVPCSFRSSRSYLLFSFPSTHLDEVGPNIKVPYEEIIYPFGYPVKYGEPRDEDGRELCYFGVWPTDGFVRLLGATMLRSAYLVFDAEALEIRMAQAKYVD